MIIRKSTIYNFFEYFIAAFFILDCRSIWLHIPDIRNLFTIFTMLLLIIGVLGCVALRNKKDVKPKTKLWIKTIILMFVFWGFFYLVTQYSPLSVVKNLIICICMFTYTCLCIGKKSAGGILKKFKNLVVIIAMVSLFFWVFGSLLSFIKYDNTVYSTWNDRKVNGYGIFYYEPQIAVLLLTKKQIIRNCAIFTEAPMCSFIFCTALIVEMFIIEKKSIINIIILSMGILSTASSTGYVVLVLSLYLFFLLIKNKYNWVFILKTMLLFGFILVIYAILFIINDKLLTISGSIRIDDFRAGFIAWKKHFIFGNGLNNLFVIQKYMSAWRSNNIGFSNSVLQIFSDGGIYLAAFYILSTIVGIRKIIKKKDIYAFIYVIIFLGIFAITIVSYTGVVFSFFIFLFMGVLNSDYYFKKTLQNKAS